MKPYFWVLPAAALLFSAAPSTVTLTGSLQSELGCSSDDYPACATTHLTYSTANDKWTKSFTVPAGTYTYSVALDDTTATVYPSSPINLTRSTSGVVKFYYDDRTHWVGDSANHTIGTLAGDMQSELGCSGDWDPSCLKSMLTDPDGDGIYTFSSSTIPVGSYHFKVAYNEAWDTSYGDKGGGNDFGFKVTQAAAPVRFSYNPKSHWSFLSGAAALSSGPNSVTVAGDFQSESVAPATGRRPARPPISPTTPRTTCGRARSPSPRACTNSRPRSTIPGTLATA